MFESIFFVLMILAVIVFALIGFISVLARLFGGKSEPISQSSLDPGPTASVVTTSWKGATTSNPNQPSLENDVLATRRLIQHLKQTRQIPELEFERILKFLESRFANELRSTPYSNQTFRSTDPTGIKLPDDDDSTSSTNCALQSAALGPESRPIAEDALATPIDAAIPKSPIMRTDSADSWIVVAEVVDVSPPIAAVVRPTAVVAPWDRPDPPPRALRRSWNEMLAGFMQEKNMRWGELTSGILIVLSAVGLVVSLREELSDTIPYFSSILFLLMTAGIIGAGIYTLKKWKLRNTSRGTLVIGLLLIPLNFVAACVLSGGQDRRSLDDVWLWAALAIGFASFGVLSWYASRFLFRKSNLAIVGCLLGCGVGTIVLNRLFTQSSSSLQIIAMLIPIGGLFLGGATVFRNRTWSKQYWSPRGTNHQLLQLGIATFAVLSASSILWIRSNSTWATTIAVSPLLILISLIGILFGSLIRVNRKANGSNNSLVGLALQILGSILISLFLLAAIANPTVFAINCTLAAVGVLILAQQRREYQWLPAAWGLLTATALTGLNLATGKFPIDQWIQPSQLWDAYINGQSGLCLLVCGGATMGIQAVIASRFADRIQQGRLMWASWVTGSCIFLVGCAVAVTASLTNRGNVFDTMTASLLLLIGGGGAIVGAILKGQRDWAASPDLVTSQLVSAVPTRHVLLTLFAAALMLAGLTHTIIWNLTIAGWLADITTVKFANWTWVFAIHGTIFATAATWKRSGTIEAEFRFLASGSSLIAVVGAIAMVPALSGNATLVLLVVTVATWMIGWSIAKFETNAAGQNQIAGIPFAVATAILVAIMVSELLSRLEWCPPYSEPGHWLIQSIALSAWAIVWTSLAMVLNSSKNLRGLVASHPRVDQVVLFGLVAVVTCLIGASVAGGAQIELFKNGVSIFSLAQDQTLVWSALAAVVLAIMWSLIERPTPLHGAALILLVLFGGAAGSLPFEESKSMASAIRWLVPSGGLVMALLIGSRQPFIPLWIKTRNRLKLSGPSTWQRESTQRLIGLALAIIVLTVLLISTITVAQVMLNGAAALGGPEADSWFGRLDKVVSFGGPLAMVVSTFLVYAISERRPWLATAGSLVFQYMVVLALILLFLSPHPKLASAWFVRILQSMSLGMTMYGFVWYLLRYRIDARMSPVAREPDWVQAVGWRGWFTQIEVHTLINGLLITGLAALVLLRFYLVPDQPAGWINSVGSLLGITAWISYAALAWTVGREKLLQHQSVANWTSLVGWIGLVLVAMVAAIFDYQDQQRSVFVPWSAFKVICAGALLVAGVQVGLLWFFRRRVSRHLAAAINSPVGSREIQSSLPIAAVQSSQRSDSPSPILLALAIALAFAVRGAWEHAPAFVFFMVVLTAAVAMLYGTGLLLRRSWWLFMACGVSLIGTFLVVARSPQTWFAPGQPTLINLSAIIVLTLALGNLLFYLYRRNRAHETIPRSFLALANVGVLIGSSWIFLGAWVQVLFDSMAGVNNSALANAMGIAVMLLVVVLLVVSIWNDRRRFWVLGVCLTSLGIAITGVSTAAPDSDSRAVGILFGCAGVMALWGIGWLRRAAWISKASRLHVPRLVSLEKNLQRQLPTCSVALLALLIPASFAGISSVEPRVLRFLAAAVPLLASIGVGCLSDPKSRRWLQQSSLGLLTLGGLYVAWADLTPAEMFRSQSIMLLERTVLVLASAMFIYGGLVTRWIREEDSWLKSLREMAALTCGLSMAGFALLIMVEASRFQDPVGCGLSIAESVSISLAVVGMIVGLISIAIRPTRDPFALSLKGRRVYVYVAQLMAAGLIAHLYFTQPWLFQLGIKEYWPYIAMAMCFGGVGVAHLLEQRKLEVLGQPIFTIAAILPVLTATAIFVIDSKADGPLIMLTVGLAYLMISYIQGSILSGAAAILFGNFALWMFYDTKLPALSFFDHPQLWLIPPAVSVLIAGQLTRHSLLPAQLATLRYICVAVIYVSSTSEIFISGLGDKLWPPMVLAVLSVIGIMAGILLQIRSFLYLGSLFLLMSMITMVAHAHQRLNHVWPWWAFGIALGIGILVMFGMFEKRKKDMKTIANRLKGWEV